MQTNKIPETLSYAALRQWAADFQWWLSWSSKAREVRKRQVLLISTCSFLTDSSKDCHQQFILPSFHYWEEQLHYNLHSSHKKNNIKKFGRWPSLLLQKHQKVLIENKNKLLQPLYSQYLEATKTVWEQKYYLPTLNN